MLLTLEILVDICFLINIALNFVKRTRQNKTLQNIWISYITSTFLFDIVGTLPCFLMGENLKFYWLKTFRVVVHMFWLTQPLEKIMHHLLRAHSKKRINDLTTFGCLILMVVFIAHFTGCYWIYLGMQYDCENDQEDCTQSWIYANGFET